jgi:hypothetical protein
VSHSGNINTGPVCNWGVSVFATTVDSISVPAGTYVVWASGSTNTTDGGLDYADFTLNGASLVQEQPIFNEGFVGVPYGLSGTVTLSSPGTISLDCVDENSVDAPVQVYNDSLTAIQVDALN